MTEVETITAAEGTEGHHGGGGKPLPETLQHALQLADWLRLAHEAGRAHGAISPATIALNGSGAKLLAAPEETGITEYSAPEVQAGQAASPQSDIFSLGALLYHIATGRTPPANAQEAGSTSCGDPALDRIIRKCMAPDPMMRYQSAQKLGLELRMLGVSGRRMRTEGPHRWERAIEHLRAETESCLRERENQSEELKRATNEAIATLRQELMAAEERALRAEEGMRQYAEQLEQHARQFGEVGEQFDRVGAAIDSAARQNAEAQQAEGVSRHALEAAVAKQGDKIESALSGIKQTDDLVAWVVEILETLQNTILER